MAEDTGRTGAVGTPRTFDRVASTSPGQGGIVMADSDSWDEVVAASWNGTFLHSRRYLACTDTGTADASLLVEDSKRRVVAVVPAAAHATDPSMIESHPAAAYGGIVHRGTLTSVQMVAALEAVADRLYHDGWRTLRYKAVPQIYHRVPAADDLSAVSPRCDPLAL